MVEIVFLGPIGLESIEIDVASIEELCKFLSDIPEMKEWIDNSAIAINDTIVLSREGIIDKSDIISILPPVCGG